MKFTAVFVAALAQAAAFAPSPAFTARPASKLFLADDKVDTLKGIIAEQLGVESDGIKMEANFQEDLGADSLDVVELVMAIEEEFEIEIDDTEAGNIATVQDVIDYLDKTL